MKLYEVVIGFFLLSALIDVSFSLKCAQCSSSETICDREVDCREGRVCYITKERHHSRGYTYESGCGSREWHCGDHSDWSSHSSYSWSHGSLLNSGSGRETKCCDSSDMCNTYLAFSTDTTTMSPHFLFTKETTDTTTTPPPFQLTEGIECQVCSGPTCGVKGDDPVIKCPDEFPHCMNIVLNVASGNKLVTKRCAKREECQRKVNDACVNFDPSEIYTQAMECIYCCETNGCNKEIVPKAETLVLG